MDEFNEEQIVEIRGEQAGDCYQDEEYEVVENAD